MKKIFLLGILFFFLNTLLFSQSDTAVSFPKDSITNQDAIYNRPFIYLGKSTTAVGGYLEGNTNYFVRDGVPEGFSMEMRRFNIFLYSTIAKRIRFLSELEFEHGTEEISLETALIDFEINSSLIFRTGILLPPIGGFNLNHDSPKWEFVDRPLVSTQIIPSTLSEIGFGIHGKFYPGNLILTYDLYVVQGLRDQVVLNDQGRTFMQSGKSDEMFAEDNNGVPMVTGKIGIKHRQIGEMGISYYGGAYNKFKNEGLKIDERRGLHIFAFDYRTHIKKLIIVGEAAMNKIDVAPEIIPLYGQKQWGFFTDFIYPVIRGSMLKWEKAVLNLNLRVERIDYNINTFLSGNKVFDEVTGFTGGISFRPVTTTVIRANYQYHWIKDILGNPTIKQAGIQVGVATYF